jgi:diaminopimelate decarboxylase
MNYFKYQNGALVAENVNISEIVDVIGTPFYCYSETSIINQFKSLEDALTGLPATICYAVKANSNIAVIKTLADIGAGADVVSSGELLRALKAGIPAKKIVFSGVGKTKDELVHALKEGILQINIESEPELDLLDEVANSLNQKAQIALRINPDIDANTHNKISTGRSEDKFGIEWTRVKDVISHANNLNNIEIAGLAMHIGSQLTTLNPFNDAFKRLSGLVKDLRRQGQNISRLDLGGGLGISYDGLPTPTPDEYGKIVKDHFNDLNCDLLFEPGRFIVGNSGILVTRVIYVKSNTDRHFLILDAAMNDLMRPCLYDAQHTILPITEAKDQKNLITFDAVGPVCETGDTFANDIELPATKAGDLYAILSAGAYGAVMSSSYNSRPIIPEVMVKDDRFSIIREQITPEILIKYESLPEW